MKQDRVSWRTPALGILVRAASSPRRKADMLTLRIYLALGVVLVIVTIARLAIGG